MTRERSPQQRGRGTGLTSFCRERLNEQATWSPHKPSDSFQHLDTSDNLLSSFGPAGCLMPAGINNSRLRTVSIPLGIRNRLCLFLQN